MSDNRKRKLTIVIEDSDDPTGEGGDNFKIYLVGDKERLGKIPEAELSAAEFWGWSLYSECLHIVKQTGSVKGSFSTEPTDGNTH